MRPSDRGPGSAATGLGRLIIVARLPRYLIVSRLGNGNYRSLSLDAINRTDSGAIVTGWGRSRRHFPQTASPTRGFRFNL